MALLVIVPGAVRAEGLPKGSYQADAWGRVELSTDQNRVVGYSAEGQPCGLAPRAKVLEGEWQGRVLVGQFTVCLKGGTCPLQASLPVIAFHDPKDGTVTTYVRPQAGCEVPGTHEGRVVLYPLGLAAEGPGTGGALGRPLKRNPEAAKQSLDKGDQLMKEKNWAAAAVELERSVALNEQSWAALLSLGTARVMLNQPTEAIAALNRARAINKREPLIYYQLACAYSRQADKKQAMAHLEQAVQLKLALDPDPEDEGLGRVLGGDLGLSARYVSLMQQAAHNAAVGRRPSPGP